MDVESTPKSRNRQSMKKFNDYFSEDEVKCKIQDLTSSEKKKMMLHAFFLVKFFKFSNIDSEDLFQEAIFRTLALKRRWKKTVKIQTHFSQIMKSIASHWCEHLKRQESYDDLKKQSIYETDPYNTESFISNKQELEKIFDLFEEDPIASRALQLKIQEMTGEEIRFEMKLSQKEWETIRKRIRRKIIQYADFKRN